MTHSSPVMQAAQKAQKVVDGWSDAKREYADRVTSGAQPSSAADRIEALEAASPASGPLGWPSLEVIAREIRRAMLDNPTGDSFNERAKKREAIANEAAGVIMARFCAALPTQAATAAACIEALEAALRRALTEIDVAGHGEGFAYNLRLTARELRAALAPEKNNDT